MENEQEDNLSEEPKLEQDVSPKLRDYDKIEKRSTGFGKNLLILLFLIIVIIGSFWLSFQLGKRILSSDRQSTEDMVEMIIPEPPEAIKDMQREVSVSVEEIFPEAKIIETAPKTVVPKIVYGKYYKVQAGYFVVKNNALNQAKSLRDKGFETFVKKVGKGWRVQVGAFRAKVRAKNLQSSLKSQGFESALVYE